MDKTLRINVRTKEATYENTPDEYLKTGGRGLIAKILLKEVKPTCEPLGRNNKLIFAMGLLTGTNASSASRVCIGSKSPLTGGIKESNAGGITAMRLAQLGLKAIIIEDIPEDDKWYYIKVEKDKCTLEPADQYVGMGTFEFCQEMLEKYPDSAVTCIGPAGERQYSAAGIATMDKDKKPNRYSGRGGLGAVMGSKKIKGIVVIDKEPIKIADKKKYKEALKEYTSIINEAPSTLGYKTLGTAATARLSNSLGGLPVNNFSSGEFKEIEQISGENLYKVIQERGGEGKTSHACMPGCIIQCSNIYPDKEGKTIVSPLEYETIGLLGSNLGIADFDTIAKMNSLCNDIGIDTIETGAAIGVAMEGGIAKFGDGEAALRLVKEIGEGTILGRVLGNGAVITGKVLGVINVPAVNGQAMPAYDPRAIKGMGVTYATSPMGADHTYGSTLKAKIEQTSTEGQAELSKNTQKNVAIIDSLGLCLFASGAIGNNHQLLVDLINARHGWDMDVKELKRISEETIRDEHRFNELAGFSIENYRIPEAFTERELPNLKSKFDVRDEDLGQVIVDFKN
jgi:aldehyde:ferredoxin oxidoreductase